jgi:hypothetical protein
MDAEQTIAEIEWLERIFEVPYRTARGSGCGRGTASVSAVNRPCSD